MQTIKTIAQMKGWSADQQRKGRTIALVPTMGFFHEGHLRLMRQARKMAEVLVVSLFVNPIQFGENEDLSRYPRDIGRDSTLAEAEDVDILFMPEPKEMYPLPPQTRVTVT